MKNQEKSPDLFTQAVSEATRALKQVDLELARTRIAKAMLLKMDAPEPHNLLGVLSELKDDDSSARKHYRAAYALDPTYKPACRNLERLVIFQWGPQSRAFDYGESFKGLECSTKRGCLNEKHE